MSTELVRYDAMCKAIEAAYEVDEVKDVRDKARALEMYAQQSQNTEAERLACLIRLRAEKRAGILLREREMAKGTRGQLIGPGVVSAPIDREKKQKPLADLGISHRQSSDWQKLAAIPDDAFEAALAEPGIPTTAGILAKFSSSQAGREDRAMDPRALWLWGCLKDFERENILSSDPTYIADEMLEHMRQTVRDMAPLVISWLTRITEDVS